MAGHIFREAAEFSMATDAGSKATKNLIEGETYTVRLN
jgi:hypothetical protein